MDNTFVGCVIQGKTQQRKNFEKILKQYTTLLHTRRTHATMFIGHKAIPNKNCVCGGGEDSLPTLNRKNVLFYLANKPKFVVSALGYRRTRRSEVGENYEV